jgi:MoaA/NifB/PqqE/SkfB family radical SAM enzyme
MQSTPNKVKDTLSSQRKMVRLYLDLRRYLPAERRKQFMNAFLVHNLIKGPIRRAIYEATHRCSLPSLINVSPTYRCNLGCRGCYAASYDRTVEMSTSNLERIITQANRLGIHFIGILGGEPLLRPDILPVLEKHKDTAFRISTNGTLTDPDIVAALKRAGNVVLFFSLEGLDPETDAWRGDGVFRQVQENMLLLKQERIVFGFSALLHARNKDAVISRRFIDRMSSLGNKFGLFFPYGPIGRNPDYSLVIEEKDLGPLLESLDTLLAGRSGMYMVEGFGYPQEHRNHIASHDCRAGLSVHITPGGNVEPCNGIQFYTENVFERGLEQVLRSPFYQGIFSLVQRCDRRCVAIYEPRRVLDAAEGFKATGSNDESYTVYRRYCHHLSGSSTRGRRLGGPRKEFIQDVPV